MPQGSHSWYFFFIRETAPATCEVDFHKTSSGRAMIHAQEKFWKVSFGDNFRPAQAVTDSLLEQQGNNDFRIFMLVEMP